MALWFGLIALQATGQNFFGLHMLDWVAIHAMAFVGAMDDRFNLRARYKAIAGLAVSSLLTAHTVLSAGPLAGHLSFLGIPFPPHAVIIAPLTMLWFWSIPQAYNLIDGINGLSLGLALLLLGVLGWNLGMQPMLAWGGLLAVLGLNFPKAHHFLGDCGALMLGTLFAILGIQAFGLSDPNLLLWVFAYPIVDVTLVVSIRKWKGHKLSAADRSHLHHWMMEHLHGRAWVVTPLLLVLAGLPMLQATNVPGRGLLAMSGVVGLISLALKVFRDRVTKQEKHKNQAVARREIPLVLSRSMSESGSHTML